MKSDLAGKVYLKQEVEKKISDNDVKNFYNQYKKEFKPQKEMRARHILVTSEGGLGSRLLTALCDESEKEGYWR